MKNAEILKEQVGNSEFAEGLEYWAVGLYEAPDRIVKRNLGVLNVWIKKYIIEVEDVEKEIFAVEIETNMEIAGWNERESIVLNEIAENPTYELGEFEVVEVFESYNLASDYAKEHHPCVDLSQLIKAHYIY